MLPPIPTSLDQPTWVYSHVVIALLFVYNDGALNCPNISPDALCAKFYDQGQNALAVGGDNERPENCFKVGGVVSDAAKQTAISTCPKQCGYCCLTPRYNCKNKASEFSNVVIR
ncbi:hypothetical protein ANCDUO_13927 [Ancylostoma duodenale]|uniref:ShKT domain-containing protein n=1 Tax=Ancylostoma duodenale TaxID=51022 RepID=A0A0C2G4L1_9BILA|nr:hypothetical protein ANCDUO_13927 [Ancylostoma duodenale]